MQSWDRIDDPNSQFFLENDRSFLDAPGEFFVDRLSRTLYYIPREGEVAATAVATVPLLTQLLEVKGSDAGVVEYVFIQGISFQHTRYVYPWQGDNPCQADALQDAAIELSWARSIAFEGCEVSHTGNWAMAFGLGCRDGKAEHCYLHDLGGGGVKIGTQVIPTDEETMLTRRICVDNCIVRDGGQVFVQAVGVLLLQASDNRITHNDIADFFYTGISVGWVWGYSHSPSTHNIVTYNHIHHIGWGALSDMGGIYTLGDARGTEVCHNRIHDIYSLGYGGWGLYTDEGTTGILMKDNLVYRCKSSGFHQHYGKDNMICNNIFVNSLRAQLEATRVEPDHLPFTFSHNIIQYEQGNMYGINWQYVNFAADENIYWNTRGAVTWNGASLEDWQKSGKDVHSLVVDPRLADVANEDFTPKNSEALQAIHFVPFNADEAGVYGDTAWTDLACYDASRYALFLKIVDQYEKRQ